MEADPGAEERVIDPLLTRPSAADHDLLDSLYREHAPRLTNLAAAITLDRGVAQEVVHDAFAGAARRLAMIETPVAYLQRSVVNGAVRAVKQRQRSRQPAAQPVGHASTPEFDELWALIAALPPRQRAVVVLRFYEDLAYRDIAEVLEIPLGTVQSTLHRALSALKEQLR